MDSEGLIADSIKKELVYPNEKFNLENMTQLLNLTKEDSWSTLTQSYPCDDNVKRTQQLIDKYNITTPQQLSKLYLKMDVLQLTSRTLLRSLLLCMVSNRCTVTQHQFIQKKLN